MKIPVVLIQNLCTYCLSLKTNSNSHNKEVNILIVERGRGGKCEES